MSQSNLATIEKFYSNEEYLAFEREADEKHELMAKLLQWLARVVNII